MKKVMLVLFLSVFALVPAAVSYAEAPPQNRTLTEDLAPNSMTFQTIKSNMEKKFPGIEVISVGTTPIMGVYEVLLMAGPPAEPGQPAPVRQPNIAYYALEQRLLMPGPMIDENGRMLGETRMSKHVDGSTSKILKDIDISKAIKIGTGPVSVIEITDPDCPYCRKLEEFLRTRYEKDVTRYVFLMPLSFHKDAEPKARMVLCSKDPGSEFEKVMKGEYDTRVPKVETGYCEDKLQTHLEMAKRIGATGTPVSIVGKRRVDGLNVEQITKYIEEDKANAGKTVTGK